MKRPVPKSLICRVFHKLQWVIDESGYTCLKCKKKHNV